MDGERYVVCMVKGPERYIWVFDDRHRSDAICSLGRMASNDDLSMTWHDAAVLSTRVRNVGREKAGRF